ncbi:hypothetical protein C0J52_22964 [Blattella germanica]|nr:hypothetical protein C0J52_22964 [Blattella germanica]
MPFYIVSFWNTVLLILSTIFHHLYDDFKQQCLATGMKPVYHLCIVIGVEVLILIVVMATYIYKVVVFNRSKPPPDVLREEWIEPGDYVYDLLEKQADLIRYLLDRNSKLSRNIMRITTQLDENNRL